jgi:HAD superfamily hydrolase (TIGR01484 family)
MFTDRGESRLMRYLALASDYDGTLATDGRMNDQAVTALERLRASGRQAILLTGRILEDILAACPRIDLFDSLVVENGAVLHVPASRETVRLAPPLPDQFTARLRGRGVTPLAVGRVIVATNHPHEFTIVEAIRDLGLELQLVFNGNAVMVLPSGVNKASGLRSALLRLGLSPHEVVGIGNAANDHSFLEICECAVAVDNAVPALKNKVAFSTRGADGAGVAELVDELVATDLAARRPRGAGDDVVLGTLDDGAPVFFAPYGQNLLVAGPSGSGKSTFATGLIERLMERSYQLCIIDPEGDYGTLADIVTLGSRLRPPEVNEIMRALVDPSANVVINLLGMPLSDRPEFFTQLLPHLQSMRARTARPHWILIDEVHHLLPAARRHGASMLPQRLGETILVTVRPREVAESILRLVDIVVAVGPSPETTITEFAGAVGAASPPIPALARGRDEVITWFRTTVADPLRMRVIPARADRLRHLRKYAEGNLGPKSFVFRGPEGKLRLRAQNLVAFCDIAAGVDYGTWSFHLRRGDYSRWFREVMKDEDLAREVATIEAADHLPSDESRRLVREVVDRRYMLPSW